MLGSLYFHLQLKFVLLFFKVDDRLCASFRLCSNTKLNTNVEMMNKEHHVIRGNSKINAIWAIIFLAFAEAFFIYFAFNHEDCKD